MNGTLYIYMYMQICNILQRKQKMTILYSSINAVYKYRKDAIVLNKILKPV